MKRLEISAEYLFTSAIALYSKFTSTFLAPSEYDVVHAPHVYNAEPSAPLSEAVRAFYLFNMSDRESNLLQDGFSNPENVASLVLHSEMVISYAVCIRIIDSVSI